MVHQNGVIVDTSGIVNLKSKSLYDLQYTYIIIIKYIIDVIVII